MTHMDLASHHHRFGQGQVAMLLPVDVALQVPSTLL